MFDKQKQSGIIWTWNNLSYSDFFWAIIIFWLFIFKAIYKISVWIFNFVGRLAKRMAKKSEQQMKDMR